MLETLSRLPRATIEFTNVLLTTPDAAIGQTPRDVIWTHRNTTLYRYRSTGRDHAVPILLVFALINRPEIFDLRPGNSFVQFLLGEGFDVFLVDWGIPDEEDSDMGVAEFVCDELHWGREDFDIDLVVDSHLAVPGSSIDFANQLMKPVTNYLTTYRRLFAQILKGQDPRVAYQAMAKWVADNPPFPGNAYRDWITWMYKEKWLIGGRLRLRGSSVDLRRIEQNLLVVTAGAGPHRASRGHRPDSRPGGQRGCHPHGPRGRPYRPDGGIKSQARDLARTRRLARRAFGPLTEGENMSVSTNPTESMVRRPRLHGRVAFVTGGTRGIGAAICHSLAEQGAIVAAGYGRDTETADAFIGKLTQEGLKGSVHQGNIGSADDCRRTVSEVIEQHGRLDILVNNAGITIDKTVLKMTDEDWYKVLAVNLSGAFFMSQAVLPHMIDRGSGRIVNISSIIGEMGNIGQANYAASKSGLFGLTKTLALEAAFQLKRAGKRDDDGIGITVNTVAPGFIATEMLEHIPEKVLEGIKDKIPVGRLGRPDEIARVVHFLVGDQSSFITGAIWGVNGGMDM